MIALFKKQKSEKEIIEEIHNEFDTAPDRLLERALEIIQNESNQKVVLESAVEDKANRLEKLGFIKNGLVARKKEIEQRNNEKDKVVDLTLQQSNLLKYYKDSYPFIKTITIDELDRICGKYGLIYAPVNHYKYPVPEKNLEDIENVQSLKHEDSQKSITTYTFSCKYKNRIEDFNKLVSLFRGDTFSEEDLHNIWNTFMPKENYRKIDDTFWYYGYLAQQGLIQNPVINEAFIANGVKTTINRDGLFIAAPKHHFDLTGLLFDENKGYFKAEVQVFKDPIVFRYVKGNMVQVVTKWGLEADDPALQMEILN